MFFDQAFGGGQGPMMGGQSGPSAFTSPGMNPQVLAMLMALQRQSGGGMGGAASPGGPAYPATPPANQNAPTGGPIPAPPGPGPMPTPPQQAQNGTQPNILQLLQRLQQGGGLAGLLGGGQPTSLLAGLAGGMALPTGNPQGGTGGYY